ncbi:hypothetical protein EDB19DRAFT_580635 [Suillus lakei]|nr:hypothetical protein EDB19DRAFT_580635 [Suillus lakei]
MTIAINPAQCYMFLIWSCYCYSSTHHGSRPSGHVSLTSLPWPHFHKTGIHLGHDTKYHSGHPFDSQVLQRKTFHLPRHFVAISFGNVRTFLPALCSSLKPVLSYANFRDCFRSFSLPGILHRTSSGVIRPSHSTNLGKLSPPQPKLCKRCAQSLTDCHCGHLGALSTEPMDPVLEQPETQVTITAPAIFEGRFANCNTHVSW